MYKFTFFTSQTMVSLNLNDFVDILKPMICICTHNSIVVGKFAFFFCYSSVYHSVHKFKNKGLKLTGIVRNKIWH